VGFFTGAANWWLHVRNGTDGWCRDDIQCLSHDLLPCILQKNTLVHSCCPCCMALEVARVVWIALPYHAIALLDLWILLYSSQVTFIYIALYKIQIISQQLYSDNRKMIQLSKQFISTVLQLIVHLKSVQCSKIVKYFISSFHL